jgi:filamin
MEDANAGFSWAEGPGLTGGKTGRHNPITIHAVDADGNNVGHGGDPFVVGISGADFVSPTISDNGDGTYSVDYVVQTPGVYAIDITLHGKHIKDSPFSALIKPDVDPSKCYAEGPGLLGASDNEEATFTIFARDGDDQPKTEGGDPFQLKFNGPADVKFNLVDNGDGTYNVTYHPDVAGDYTLQIELEGQPIKNAPYSIHFKEGTDTKNTGFSNFTFTIQTRDKNNNPKSFGGDQFAVEVAGPSPVDVATTDNGDGTYTASYLLRERGQYKLTIKFNGQELAVSPLTQQF